MSEWHERLAHDIRPSVRAEHDLRYRAAAGLVVGAPVWVDLGCGHGVAAAAAVGDRFAGRAVLVDVSEHAVQEAAATVRAGEVRTVVADLTDEGDAARVRAAAVEAGDGGVVTAFEVIEHLASYVALVELMVDLAGEHGYTAVLSAPNDAFWAIENPHHPTMWGEGAFEELRRLLPADHVVARQVPVVGSALVVGDGDAEVDVERLRVEADRVPSHFLAAFGPRARELAGGAVALAADLDGQRAWERQREAQLALYEAQLAPPAPGA